MRLGFPSFLGLRDWTIPALECNSGLLETLADCRDLGQGRGVPHQPDRRSCVAPDVCVAHEQIAEAARQASEPTVRTERQEVRVRSLSDELASPRSLVSSRTLIPVANPHAHGGASRREHLRFPHGSFMKPAAIDRSLGRCFSAHCPGYGCSRCCCPPSPLLRMLRQARPCHRFRSTTTGNRPAPVHDTSLISSSALRLASGTRRATAVRR